MVKPIAIASTSVVLLVGAARFTDALPWDRATPETATPVTISAEGPTVPNATPSTAASEATSLSADVLAGQLQVLALYGDSDALSFSFFDPTMIDEETLWLARCIYSETKLPHEQELVAWVVRNRVETNYRGRDTYEGVVLDPYQFSAFNPSHPKRSYYASLTPMDSIAAWQQALRIAYQVRNANTSQRPFSIETRHFFSIQSMPDEHLPHWVQNRRRVDPNWSYRVDQRRFRFYEAVS